MSNLIKAEINNGALSKNVSSAVRGFMRSPYAKYRALAGLNL